MGQQASRPGEGSASCAVESVKPDAIGFPPVVIPDIALEAQTVAEAARCEVEKVPLVGEQLKNEAVTEASKRENEFENVLRDRGEIVGEVIVDTFTSSSTSSAATTDSNAEDSATMARVGEILQASLKDSPAEHLPVKEMVSALDPLITPVLDPFVEGLTQPIYKVVDDVKTKVYVGWILTGLACGVAGYSLGKVLPKGPGKKKKGQ